MRRSDLVRLGVALAHAVPGSRIDLTCPATGDVVVAHHPAADIDPCTMRRVVVAGAGPEPGRPAGWCDAGAFDLDSIVTSVVVSGSLEDIGGGLYRRRLLDGTEERWFATLLPPDHVATLLEDVADAIADGDAGQRAPDDDSLDARIVPDDLLGVSIVRIAGDRSHDLDVAAHRSVSACLVEEALRLALRNAVGAPVRRLDDTRDRER
jgi:hypothetical protein